MQYVSVLHRGCRCIEIDSWDGPDDEPVVRHGYTATTTILFEDVINAIADHAFVTSQYPVVISIEQRCHKATQLLRQGAIMEKILGDRLLKPPWNDATQEIDWEKVVIPSPESAKGKIIVKSSLCKCNRCKRTLEDYNRCVFMPTMKLAKHCNELQQHMENETLDTGRQPSHCASFT